MAFQLFNTIIFLKKTEMELTLWYTQQIRLSASCIRVPGSTQPPTDAMPGRQLKMVA